MIAFREGGLAEVQAGSLQSHLDQCEGCRLEFHRLQSALGNQREPAPDRSLLARMQSAIQRWEDSASQTGRTGTAVKRRVATEIAPFLGPEATSSILKPVAEGGENLLSSIEPVLALFLGGRAAAHLVTHVVDAALIRA
jgi:hypothetical protein